MRSAGFTSSYDVIVVGGGHNGLVAAAYLAEQGLKVIVLERSAVVGGPLAQIELIPGYRCSVTNSPGSLEPKIVQDLDLGAHGLNFVYPDPTLVHPLEGDRLFVAWRDRARTAEQLDAFADGENDRYSAFFEYFQNFADRLGVSLYDSPPTLQDLVRNLSTPEDQEAFSRIFFGNAKDLFEDFGFAEETKAILAPISVSSGFASPSTPGTPVNYLMRPLSLASSAAMANDPRKMPLRGSTGLPLGGMHMIAEAMARSAEFRGATIRKSCSVMSIRTKDGRILGVTTSLGEEIDAHIVISAASPYVTICELLRDDDEWTSYRAKMARKKMTGISFKLVLALDRMPTYEAAPTEMAKPLAGAQFRIGPTLDYIEQGHLQMMSGRAPENPVIWGLCPSMTSEGMAPDGRHVLSLNIGNVPFRLREGDWITERDKLAKRCIAILSEWMPTLPDSILDYRCLDPTEIESRLAIHEANLTHGDILPWNQFWMRPLPGLQDYRTPTRGLYLSGCGTWPGNFVSGIPGHNTSQAVLRDLRAGRISAGTSCSLSMNGA